MSERSEERVGAPTTSVGAEVSRLVELAWPVAVAQLGFMMLGVVDVLMVGQLGEGALAGVMLGHTFAFSLQALLLGAAVGLDPLFSQAIGARRPDRAGEALARGGALLGLMCLPIMGLHLGAEPLLLTVGQPEEAAAIGGQYAFVRTLSVPLFAGLMLMRGLLQARGQMMPGAIAILLGNGVNVLFNGALLFGWFGAPVLGPVGVAWASVAATAVMFLALVLLSGDLFAVVRPRWSAVRDRKGLVRAMGLALPVSAQVALESWGFSVATVLMGWLGETALAAHAIALTLASLAFMVPLGISAAASARVGNLLGAGHPWGRAAAVAVALGACSMAVFVVPFATFPTLLASLFTAEGAVILVVASLLPVAAGFAFFDAVQVVTFGVLRGVGDTAVPAAANVVGYYLLGLPLGAALAFGVGLGAVGVWLGLASALATVAVLLLLRLVSTHRRGGFAVG
ncbi:MAG: MATE family efflux transporter [Deltaproteobacteria bacterium]|nr:MAG: MATE family efflux transporter [Deltaproteobacteria bacterium]